MYSSCVPQGLDASIGARAKAEVLVEALPYIRRFWGKVVVVKYGGNALAGASEMGQGALQLEGATEAGLSLFATDIVLMRSVGMLPVVVHGGGPQIGELMRRLGKAPEFKDGLRVTDSETLEIARMVLVGKVNREIVTAINVHGPLAVGVSGEDAGTIRASLRDPELGFVGDIVHVEPELLQKLLSENLVPVVATIGADQAGQAYNINADSAAGALAKALRAEKLVFLTDVEGVRADPADPASLQSQLSAAQLDMLLGRGAIQGGMVPKVAAALDAVAAGVAQVHILDGRVPHALLLEFFTKSGVGTMVVP
jgi:acetylglutamate kinase